MTLYTFPDPSELVRDALEAGRPTYWPTATISSKVPGSGITVPHIQHAWDGTPSEERNREGCAIRVTAWAPKAGGVQMTAAKDLAALVRAYLLDNGIAGAWRVTRGTGRLPGIDDATGLPFCTFTLTAETRPSPVA